MEIISSETVKLADLFRAGAYEPARVQREYCWDTPQIETLLEDLTSAFAEFEGDAIDDAAFQLDDGMDQTESDFVLSDADDEPAASAYFLGTIVIQPDGGTLFVYDGLQRFTTLTILFCVLRDRLETDEFNDFILVDDRPRLKMAMKHRTFDVDIIAPGRSLANYPRVANLSEAGKRLRHAATLIRDELAGWQNERLLAFARFVQTVVRVSVLRISDRRVAGKAFTTINSTGVRLKDDEIIKGQLIELAAEMPKPAEAEDDILRVWRNLHDEFGAEFADFMKAVDFLERRKPQGRDVAIQLMEHIGRRYRGVQGFEWVKNKLPLYASAYRWLEKDRDSARAKGEAASLRRLSLLPWPEWKAAAMLIRFKTTRPQDRASKLDLLDRRCFTMHLALDHRSRAMVLARAIENYAQRGRRFSLTLNATTKEKARLALARPLGEGSSRQNTILRWVEAAHHENDVPSYVSKMGVEDGGSTVEHVYPKNPELNWPAFASETPAEQTVLAQSLGNLCLLPKDDLGNAPFKEKRREYARMSGFLFARQIGKQPDWTPDSVRTRTTALMQYVSAKLEL